jgi:hypothetical protein
VRAVAKRLGFGQPARTPPIALTFFDLNGNRLPSADLCHFAHEVHLCSLLTFSRRVSPLGPAKAPQGVPSSRVLLPQIEGISHHCQSRNEHKVERCVADGTIIRRVVDVGDMGRRRKRADRGRVYDRCSSAHKTVAHWAANAPNRATELLRNTARRVP